MVLPRIWRKSFPLPRETFRTGTGNGTCLGCNGPHGQWPNNRTKGWPLLLDSNGALRVLVVQIGVIALHGGFVAAFDAHQFHAGARGERDDPSDSPQRVLIPTRPVRWMLHFYPSKTRALLSPVQGHHQILENKLLNSIVGLVPGLHPRRPVARLLFS
jgi:hypothetical protein